MEWIKLTDESQLKDILEQSNTGAAVIFKYSSRCGVCDVALHRLERNTPPADVKFYFLDVLRHRPLSQQVAAQFHVHHESPQILVIRNGECIYDDSHNGINMQDIAEQVRA